MACGSREAVIDYEFLRGWQNDTVVKELCVASATASETFRFKSPYKMADHGSSEKGIKFADDHIQYSELHTVLNEAVAGFAHLYAYGVSKCSFLAGLTGRPIHNLEDLFSLRPSRSITRVCAPCPAASSRNIRTQPKQRILCTIG
jgi:hypothetical protein